VISLVALVPRLRLHCNRGGIPNGHDRDRARDEEGVPNQVDRHPDRARSG